MNLRAKAVRWMLAVALGAAFALPARADDNDPIEPFNRSMFWFNERLDLYLLEPVAKGWDFVAPELVQTCVANFFDHIGFPALLANDLLQAKWVQAASDTGRFVVNTTAGWAGLFDPAVEIGLVRHNEDFGQTLGYWGVPQGPYLMLPVMGPFTIRDGVGYLVDINLAVYPLFVPAYVTIGPRVLGTVNWRAQSIEQIDNAREASLDYYAFVRNAYLQRREALVNDSEAVATEDEEDLYFQDDDEEGDDE